MRRLNVLTTGWTGVLLAALLLPGGVLLLAWMLYQRHVRRPEPR